MHAVMIRLMEIGGNEAVDVGTAGGLGAETICSTNCNG